MKEIISTEKAPAAIGPYSQAVKAGNLLFISGQIPVDPATGEVVEATIQAQTAQSLTNLKAILAHAGGTMGHVVKTTVFLSDMENFVEMNRVYKTFFEAECPARCPGGPAAQGRTGGDRGHRRPVRTILRLRPGLDI